MSPFHFYIPPAYLRLFGVKPHTNFVDLWQKRNDLMGGQEEEEFQKTNPKTYMEIQSAWSLLADPDARPYLVLGVSKNILQEELSLVYTRLVSRFPLLLNPECNQKISRAFANLGDPEIRLFIDFFTFDDSLWHLWFLETEDEIATRREIEKEFSGSISHQIINSTLYCHLKACQIEEAKGDFEQTRSFWKKAYLGWQGIFQEAFIWEEMRNRILSGGLFPKSTTSRFNDASLERVRERLKNVLIENSLDRAQMALQHSIQATLNHLGFLKYFRIDDPAQRTAIARVYNHCAYVLSREGRLEEARSLLEQSMAFDPDLVEAVSNFELIQTATSGLGQALRFLSHHKEKEALETLQKILQHTPQDSDAKELYVTLLHKMSHDACRTGEYEEAFSYLSLVCEFHEDYKKELELALRLKQKNILLKVTQYIQNEEYEQGTRILRDYIKSYPDQVQAKKLLAHILNQVAILKNRQRLWTEARECLKEALYLDPENDTLKSNLSRVDKAAENQQIANDLSQASLMIQESRSREAIDLLQPIYTGQLLPPSIRDEIRHLLASAYLHQGMTMMQEAEDAASQRAIRELLCSAHLSLVISDFLHPLETVKKHIAMLEQTLPDLVDQQYNPTVFPQAPGERRHAMSRSRLSRFWKKIRIRMRMGFDLLPRALSTPCFIPLSLIPLAGISVLLVSRVGGSIISALVLALFIQAAVSLYFIAGIKSQKKKTLLFFSFLACVLVLGNLAWIAFLKGQIPDFDGLFRLFRKPAKPTGIAAPSPSKTPKPPEKTPIPIITPVPGKSEGPGFFAPIWDLSGKIFEEKKIVSVASTVTPVKPISSVPTPTTTTSPTAETTPSMIGQTVELSFIIQEFIGIRQKPTPAFMYQITTQGGMGTLVLDPLVYIKISKDRLEHKGWQKARVKVIVEGEINAYSLESPSDLSL